MTKLVITHKVNNVAAWKSYDAEREHNMGAFAADIRSYTTPDNGDEVAVTMTVHDMAGLQAFLQSEACDEIMQRHGVIKPVTLFVE
jgi:hypothetical protein